MPLLEDYEQDTNFSEQGAVDEGNLDVELEAIATSLRSIIEALYGILRDDGKIQDGLLEPYMLSSALRAMLVSNVNPVDPWAEGVEFSRMALTTVGEDSWLCVEDHTSGVDFVADAEAGYWIIFSRALQLAEGVLLKTAAFADIGVSTGEIPTVDLADARYQKINSASRYYESAVHTQLLMPGGGSVFHSGNFTGYAEILFPQNFKTVHFRMVIDVLQTSAYAKSFSIVVSGSADEGLSTFADHQACLIDADADLINVRYGVKDSKMCIWLGSANTVWRSATLSIREIVFAGADKTASLWLSGWTCSFVASTGTVHKKIAAIPANQVVQLLTATSVDDELTITSGNTGAAPELNFENTADDKHWRISADPVTDALVFENIVTGKKIAFTPLPESGIDICDGAVTIDDGEIEFLSDGNTVRFFNTLSYPWLTIAGINDGDITKLWAKNTSHNFDSLSLYGTGGGNYVRYQEKTKGYFATIDAAGVQSKVLEWDGALTSFLTFLAPEVISPILASSKVVLFPTYANLAAINLAIPDPERGMSVFTATQGQAVYTTAWYRAVDETTLIT